MWINAEATFEPDAVDTTASKVYNYVRRNIREEQREDEEGNKVELTHSNYIAFMMSRDRKVRRAAFDALYTTYRSYSATIPAIWLGS